MRIFFLFFAFIALLAMPVDAQSRFSQVIEDLPLPLALTEDTQNTVLFDKPSGRFIELQAYSDALAVADIKLFYDKTLPELGWQKTAPQLYVRDGEQLKIYIEQKDKITHVIFTLTPRKI